LTAQASVPLTLGKFLTFQEAIAFARRVHAGQKRANGRAFMSHPMAVLQILRAASDILPHVAYVAAILHDTVEDGRATVQQIRLEFGNETADAVEALTRTPLPRGADIMDHEQAYLARMAQAHARLPFILHIKMADRLHNLETVQHLPQERQLATIRTTSSLYLPLLRRVEMRQTEYTEAFSLLLAQLEESVRNRMHKPKEAFTMR